MTQVVATTTYGTVITCRRCNHDAGDHVAKSKWVSPSCRAQTIHLMDCLCPVFVPPITISPRHSQWRQS